MKIKSWMNSLRFRRPTQFEIHGQWWSANYKLRGILIKKIFIIGHPHTHIQNIKEISDKYFAIYFDIKKSTI